MRYSILSFYIEVSYFFQLGQNEQFDIKAGDYLGFYFPSSSIIPFSAESCSFRRYGLYVRSPSNVRVGSVYSFSSMLSSWRPCRDYSLKVHVKPQGKLYYYISESCFTCRCKCTSVCIIVVNFNYY